MKFKVGDKVKIRNTVYDFKKKYVGDIVTIKNTNPNKYFVEEAHYGVDLPYIFYESELELVHNEKIVITTDGVEVLARLYEGEKVVKAATSKCNPEDTFDFKVGAKLAYDRLMGEEKVEEHLPFKVGDRVVANDSYTKDKDEIGTIICIKSEEKRYGVDFDKSGVGLHNCGGFNLLAGTKGTSGNCLWMETNKLRHYEEPTTPKFKVGDKVIGNNAASKRYGVTKQGWRGTVTKVYDSSFSAIGKEDVAFDLKYDYFDLDESKDTPESTFKPGDKVKVIKNTCRHFYQIGDIVTLNEPHNDCMGRKGWKLNLGYIVEEDIEPYVEPLYNGKVVCVDLNNCNSTIYTVGKIYQFKDGQLTGDNGCKFPCDTKAVPIHNFKDWEKWTGSKFIEVKE